MEEEKAKEKSEVAEEQDTGDISLKKIAATVGLLVLAFVAILFLTNLKNNGDDTQDLLTDTGESSDILGEEGNLMDENQTQSDDLQIEDIVIGEGAEASPSSKVTVHYNGMLTDGTKFDNSFDRGEPFSFTLGAGSVIQGWEIGVVGMKVGGKRRLTIPPRLGYGERGAPPSIPPNATLIFDIELIGVE